mgnify:CR=1 FL=1
MSEKSDLFQEYIGEKIALYGLGTETKKALLSLEGRFEIIGLLDSFQEEGKLYGKDIFPLNRVLERDVKLIIVVARPGSCKAIAKKIGDICREHNIALMDIRGKDLLEIKRITYDFTGIGEGTKEELYRKIAQAEVISFDLFDTLVIREVLSPTDIIELTDAALKEKGIYITDLVSRRLEAEKRLAKYGAPTLEEIYEDVIRKSGGIDAISLSAHDLAMTEWETDCKFIVARQAMCDIFEFCVQQGKQVYIVTDTYYRQDQIERILEKCHLTGYTGLLVSCEYHTGKTQELFKRFKEITVGNRCLHIGDDLAADIEMAAKARIDTFHIFSGEELLDMVGNMGMESHMGSLPERLKIGMFAAKLFNNPFQFELEERRIALSDAYDIGYLICAPIITDFIFWFREQVQYYGIRNVWFCARDGYLLQKLYQMLEKDTDTIYFQTSRMAAVRAGMMNDADIAYVDSMKFSGTLEENLEVRFGLEADKIERESRQDRKGQATTGGKGNREQREKMSALSTYKDCILEHAVVERRRYRAYIDTLNIHEGDVVFFDFVAKGTTQLYVQRLVDHHIKGLYFLQLEPDFMSDKGLDIEAFYKTEKTDSCSIYEDYYVLETILTAPHPSICGFNEEGEPLFAEETRRERDIRCFMRAQEGILDYFCRYLELLPVNMRGPSKELSEVFLKLIHNLKVEDEDFLSLIVEDPFFNRTTEIKTLI